MYRAFPNHFLLIWGRWYIAIWEKFPNQSPIWEIIFGVFGKLLGFGKF
jgi:hypothetical protein